jgi:two-component system chemotaxis response regulator CheB
MERIFVIGASAGGVTALESLCADLPADFPAPMLIVMHVAPQGNDLLERLSQCSRLPVAHATDGQMAVPGHILIAAPGRHLTVTNESGQARVKLVDSGNPLVLPPAIDPLFHSAAEAFRAQTVGVVLSGFLDDGAQGLRAIKIAGGTAIVQDPLDAMHADMPNHAIRAVTVDSVLPAAAIGPALTALAHAARTHTPVRLLASIAAN